MEDLPVVLAGIIGELAVLVPPPSELRFLLGRTRFTNGERNGELIGIAHPHGAELTWLEPRTFAEPFR